MSKCAATNERGEMCPHECAAGTDLCVRHSYTLPERIVADRRRQSPTNDRDDWNPSYSAENVRQFLARVSWVEHRDGTITDSEGWPLTWKRVMHARKRDALVRFFYDSDDFGVTERARAN